MGNIYFFITRIHHYKSKQETKRTGYVNYISQQKAGSSREGEFSLTTWGIHGHARKPLRVTLQKQLQFLPDTIRTLIKVQLRLRGKGDQTPTHLHEKYYIYNIFTINFYFRGRISTYGHGFEIQTV